MRACSFCNDGTQGDHPECVLRYVQCGEEEVEMEITHTGGPLWKVKSESSDKWYNVDLDAPNCNCTNFAIARNKLKSAGKYKEAEAYQCKHLRAVTNSTGVQVNQPSMDAEEKAKVQAKKTAILSKFVERESTPQENALRKALAGKKK